MRLVAFSVEGYRRFMSKTSVKLHGDLIAIVGPNEAGKSSLLRAMTHLHKKGGFEQNERSRRKSLEPRLTWHLQLEGADKSALADIPDCSHIERVDITKSDNPSRVWTFFPRNPKRDRKRRQALAASMSDFRKELTLLDDASTTRVGFSISEYDEVVSDLKRAVDDYTPEDIRNFDVVSGKLIQLGIGDPETDLDSITESERNLRLHFKKRAEKIAQTLSRLADHEREESPWRRAVDTLLERLPKIVFFDDDDRELASQYDLREIANNPPRALSHLANLANLDLVKLLSEVEAGATADVATRRNAANQRLLEVFEQSWNQQGIAIQVEVQGVILHIHATTPEDNGLSEIGDRSDGMRWFAALLAFAYGFEDAPILLVDEIEKHLHYDAQADLIAVLSKQKFTSKTIYTTHSFGCLPYDLGTGVRVVQPIESGASRLENGFWKSGSGFSPLLASMGAAAMSFTPTRHALICEGAADAILLPTLLRQASELDRLGFQVAPGLSSVAAMAVPDLDAEAGRVGFVVDGDPGGRDIHAKLTGSDISPDRIIILHDDDLNLSFEVEDLVDPEIYVEAVNQELHCWNEVDSDYSVSDLPENFRTKHLSSWCADSNYSTPAKVAVAQRVVEMASDRRVFATAREVFLQSLLASINNILLVR